MSTLERRSFLKSAFALTVVGLAGNEVSADEKPGLTMIVMDPLAGPLACSCVKGYAQRDYEKLAKFLSEKIGQPIRCVYSSSLGDALAKKSEGKADIIVGKESVVRAQSVESKITANPIAALTGKDGKTTMTGLIVVAAKDAALTASDLKEHRILFGKSECDEKYKAAIAFLKEIGLETPKEPETCATCGDGATKVIDAHKKGDKVAAVISSYAQPLLEGCGTIEKGAVRVVGETEPVPFIVTFVNNSLSEDLQKELQKALMTVSELKDLCIALESKSGFVPVEIKKK